MTDDKIAEIQRLCAEQEIKVLHTLLSIREQMAMLNAENNLFRLYINNYTKNPIYYAHLYDDNGRQTDARMSCQTTDKEAATLYAKEHRDAFLKDYYAKKRKNDFYTTLSKYYTGESELFEKAKNKRNLREQQQKQYKSFIDNYFIPFLLQRKITTFDNANNIDFIEDFQRYCQDETQNNMKFSLSAKTLNDRVSNAVAPIFNQKLKEKSVFQIIKKINVKAKPGEKRRYGFIPPRTTYSILMDDRFWKTQNETKNGIPFLVNKIKNIEKYRLYCYLGNLCGLRSAEVFFLRKENIIQIGKTHFLHIENSRSDGTGTKTEAGNRLVPLYPIVYQKLLAYIANEKRTDYIFYNGSKNINTNDSLKARTIFGLLCGYDDKSLNDGNIVFHSFRHFFKTMLQNKGIEVELVEYTMGHSNKSDMKSNYLHLGSIGDQYLEKNGKKILDAIDSYCLGLFTPTKWKKIDGKEETAYTYNLQAPILKDVIYYDVAHPNKGKKRRIWTIPNPETIEYIKDDDSEDMQEQKSVMEQFNERNTTDEPLAGNKIIDDDEIFSTTV